MSDLHTTLIQNKRIEYIDALRGFVMFLVVFNHMAGYCWHIKEMGISFHDRLEELQMPMFFFISGFVSFKPNLVWNGRQVISLLKKKFPLLMISPFFFFLPYLQFEKIAFYDGITDTFKVGYWFTFVLFLFFAIYTLIRFLFRNRWIATVISLVLGLFLHYIIYQPIYNAIPLSADAKGFLSLYTWIYFIYFALGAIAREHLLKFEKLLDSKWLLPSCIMIYFLLIIYKSYFNSGITIIPVTITGLIVLFSFFRIYQSHFTKEHALGRTLQFMGRRTLDIYWIHFFFIPVNLTFVTVFREHPMPVIEAGVSFVIASIIIACSLFIGSTIRLSPILAHWLFGEKIKPKKSQTTTDQ